jgi:hypothetical protein
MQKIIVVTWSIIRYPSNSEFFELQGKYDPYNDGFLVTTIPYDFDSFDVESKIGKSSFHSIEREYHLKEFISTKEVSNEKLALQIIKEWTENDNVQCLFQRGPVLSTCSCDYEK